MQLKHNHAKEQLIEQNIRLANWDTNHTKQAHLCSSSDLVPFVFGLFTSGQPSPIQIQIVPKREKNMRIKS